MLFWVVGGVIGLVGLVVAAWALWGDRARGRKRCGRCWYSMEGVGGLTCPECGRAAKGERGLFRTRRRWWRAVGGVVVMVLGAVVAAPAYVNVKLVAPWLPRPALVMLARFGEQHGPAYVELRERAEQTTPPCASWADWEMRWFVREVAGEGQQVNQPAANPFNAQPQPMSAREILVALGPRLKRATVELIAGYRVADKSEGWLLELFEQDWVGDDRVVRAIAARSSESRGAGVCRRIKAMVHIANGGKREVVLTSLRTLLMRENSERECALSMLCDLDPTGEATLRELESLATGSDSRGFALAMGWMGRMEPAPLSIIDRALVGATPERMHEAVRTLALCRLNHCDLGRRVLGDDVFMGDVERRWWAVMFVNCCTPRPVDVEARLLKLAGGDASRQVRASAIVALAHAPVGEAAFEVGVLALQDEDATVRRAAVQLVTAARHARSGELLAMKLSDPSKDVADAARAAMDGMRATTGGVGVDVAPADAAHR